MPLHYCFRSRLHPQRHALCVHSGHAHCAGGRLPAGRAADRHWCGMATGSSSPVVVLGAVLLLLAPCLLSPSPRACTHAHRRHLWAPSAVPAADGHHAFATCMLSYGFMGDVMAESEHWRWLGPLRYDVVRAAPVSPFPARKACLLRSFPAQQRAPLRCLHSPRALDEGRRRRRWEGLARRVRLTRRVCPRRVADWGQDAGSQPLLPNPHLLPARGARPAGGGGQGV